MGVFTFLSSALQLFSRHDDPKSMPSTSAIKSKTRLPTEIVIQILKEVSLDTNSKPDYCTLSACALVCKDWSIEAQRLLFNTVTLRSHHGFVAFQAAVTQTTPRGCILGNTVQNIACVLDPKQPNGLSQGAFAHAVTSCPNLRHVDLAAYDIGVIEAANELELAKPSMALFDDSTIDTLRSGPQIDTLKFSNWTDNVDGLTQLLDVWPSLRSISLTGTPPRHRIPVSGPYPGALESLNMNFQAAPCLEYMRWLLHNSKGSLHALEFQRQPSSELFGYLLAEHASTLKLLAVPTCASREGAAALSQCMELRQLHLENAWTAPSVCRAFPPMLEHIAISVDHDTSLQPVLQAIKKSSALSKVTLHSWPNRERNPQLSAIHIACAVRGIELNIVQDIQEFRALYHLY